MDICIGFFSPFVNDQLEYQNFFLSWDVAGGIVISVVCQTKNPRSYAFSHLKCDWKTLRQSFFNK